VLRRDKTKVNLKIMTVQLPARRMATMLPIVAVAQQLP
jgi:hypothetical protein